MNKTWAVLFLGLVTLGIAAALNLGRGNIHALVQALRGAAAERTFRLEDAVPENCRVEGEEIVALGEDPQLVWNAPFGKTYFDSLVVDVEAQQPSRVEVFWTTGTTKGFTASDAVCRHVGTGENHVVLPLNRRVCRVRLDLGTVAGERFWVHAISGRFDWSWRDVFTQAFILKTFLVFLPLFILLLHVVIPARDIWSFADRYRYGLALAVLAFAVLFKLNGSSIGMWNQFVPNAQAQAPLFGKPRPIRSDEWAAFTPLTLAQSYGGEKAYAYFNEIPRGAKTDMFSVYAQPVKHPLLAFRPFLAGFVFLGFERGLAFFWTARWLALFLVMYALFKRLTSQDKVMSAIGATMVVLSPVVQWWGAINALAEMLIFGALAVLLLDRFLTEASFRRRILPATGLAYCAVAYAMTLYPAAMVPIGYVFAALAIGMFFQRAKGFRLGVKTGFLVLGAGAAALAVLAFYIWKSQEAFRLTAETVYPGARIGLGGGCWQNLTNAWGNLFLPWSEQNLEGNAFERSAFLDFFPMGVVLAVYAMAARRRLDAIALALLGVCAVLFAYCVVGFPELLAKATLLGRSTGERASVAFGLAQLLLLFRAMSLLEDRRHVWWRSVIIAAVFAAFSSVASRSAYGGYLTDAWVVIIALVSFAGCVLLLHIRTLRRTAAVFFAGLMFLAGWQVNPLQQGAAGILASDLAREIRQIAQQDKGLWFVDASGYPLMEYPIMMGAPTINSTNIYPVRERWEMLDPEKQYEEAWNRYAHIQMTIVPEHARTFRLTQGDFFVLDLPNADVVRLGVKYVLSPRDLTALSNAHAAYRKIGGTPDYNIYCVEAAAPTGEARN